MNCDRETTELDISSSIVTGSIYRGMKSLLILLLLPLSIFGQFNLKKELPSLLTAYGAGMCEGGAETLKFHFYKVRQKYPNVNEHYWNPDVSWTNKYKNGDPLYGPKYFGSTTFLAWTTDGYHLLRTQRNALFGSTLVLKLSLSEKKKWYWYVVDAAAHSLAYQAGFHTTYSLMFK